MPLMKYRNIKLTPMSLQQVKQVNTIVAEYDKMGYNLTLRQVYYQMVARDIIPNNMHSYKNLGNLISKARLTGLVDWHAIEDRTRYVRRNASWVSPESIVESAVQSYHRDLRATQEEYIEVWVEKDALIGIIERAARRNDVPFFSCRGYTSQSEMWGAAQRLMTNSNNGERPVTIIHLGDHDPSGIDMSRDIEDRLTEFGADGYGIVINRIALNFDQIEEYSPPPNPTKDSDVRSKGYREQFGEECWELDALNPQVLDQLIQAEIDKHTDNDKYEAEREIQEQERDRLRDAIEFVSNRDNWLNRDNLVDIGQLKLTGEDNDLKPVVELEDGVVEDNVYEPDGTRVYVIQEDDEE
jgi:hypothetical protein